MRIAYVCADPGIPLLGDKGASVHLRSLAEALGKRGHEVLTLAARLDGLNPPPAHATLARLEESSLQENLRDWQAQVVLERYSLATEAALTAARALHLPYVLEVNAPLVDEAATYRGLKEVARWKARERRILQSADAVITVSAGVRAHVIRCGVFRSRAVVVHNGVDPDPFARASGEWVRRRYELGETPLIGFTGSLKPWHGVDLLLEAVAGLDPQPRVLIVGDGPQREALHELAIQLGITDQVTFTGAVPHERVPAYLAAMAIGVAPYRRQAAFYFSPLKIMEYLAAGLPVVASRQGEIPEIVGDAGLLIRPDDVHALRDGLRTLLADPARRRAMAEAARRQARLLTWDVTATRVETVLTTAQKPGARRLHRPVVDTIGLAELRS